MRDWCLLVLCLFYASGCCRGYDEAASEQTTDGDYYQNQYNKSAYDSGGSEDLVNGNMSDDDTNYPDNFNATPAKIYNGREARRHAWPWMAGLVRYKRGRAEIFCGATLITNNCVVTAAHCVLKGKGRNFKRFAVLLGAHTVTDGAIHSVSRILPHPLYRNYINDIALVWLRRPVKYSSHVRPISLPWGSMASSNFEGQTAFVTGWGSTSYYDKGSRVLREAQVRVVPREQCIYWRTSKEICAVNPRTDTCPGDSGGPIMIRKRNGKWVIIGITFFGQDRCALGRPPVVYTRIGAYLPWIDRNIP